jgi:ubiquinone/menaquinone biosynthesis C-methylase UbiE
MAHHVCPRWLGYLLASPLRRLFQDPRRILSPYVRPGMVVLEPGPGMGFFTLELARLVGPAGRVIAIDLQPEMLHELGHRAAKAGLLERIELRVARPDSLVVADLAVGGGQVDFVLAFALVHELQSADAFFAEAAAAMKPGAFMLLVEPLLHVRRPAFERELLAADEAGLTPVDRPAIRRNHAALLRKGWDRFQ